MLVNYHDGLLPKYRGLSATKWSRYLNEKSTGFTYHLINQAIDDGNMLIQDAVPIPESISFYELEYRKTVRASKHLEVVLDLMLNRSGGIEQKGLKTYFGKKDFEAITTINNPSQLTFDETDRRLHSFGALRFNINGKYHNITKFKKIASSRKNDSKSYFATKDNVMIQPTRISYLPIILYKFYQFILKLFKK